MADKTFGCALVVEGDRGWSDWPRGGAQTASWGTDWE